MTRPAFQLRGIPVFIGPNTAIAFGVISWIALPTAESIVGTGFASIPVALFLGTLLYCVMLVHNFAAALVMRAHGYEVGYMRIVPFGVELGMNQPFTKPWHLVTSSLAGPLATAALGFSVWLLTYVTFSDLLTGIFSWLFFACVFITILNSLPGLPLAGGRVVEGMVWALTKDRRMGLRVAGYCGFGVAALAAASPFIINGWTGSETTVLDYIIAVMLGSWISLQASAALRASQLPVTAEQVETAVSDVQVGSVARRCVAVSPSMTCAQAIAEAERAGAGSIIITENDVVIGIVRGAALAAIPNAERTHVAISNVARRVTDDDKIRSSQFIHELTSHIAAQHAMEWLVLDEEGKIVGVLERADLQQQMTRGNSGS